MIVRQSDGKLIVQPFAEKLNLCVPGATSIKTKEIQEWVWDDETTYERTITIRSDNGDDHNSAVVLVLEARTKEALEIKQE